MGYNRETIVSCTNPDILASGSTFNKKWADCIVSINEGTVVYYSRKDYLIDALIELSKQESGVTFTAVTWNDLDFYDCVKYTLIIKNGTYDVVRIEPIYQYFFPVIDDDEYNQLAVRFKKHINTYLKRIDIIHEDPVKGSVFDFLNDIEEEDGFRSYYTIVWENRSHKFVATKRFTSHVIVDYQKKESNTNKLLEFEKDQNNNQNISDELPF